jgi:hypothetical protein
MRKHIVMLTPLTMAHSHVVYAEESPDLFHGICASQIGLCHRFISFRLGIVAGNVGMLELTP